MTIDEAIVHAREVAEEPEQLVEWLEELKLLRTTKETMFGEIYNQALEDFIHAYYQYCEIRYGILADDELVDMLKVKKKLMKKIQGE